MVSVNQVLRQTDDANVHGTTVFRKHGRLNLYLRAVRLKRWVYVVTGRRLVACSEKNALTRMTVNEPQFTGKVVTSYPMSVL